MLLFSVRGGFQAAPVLACECPDLPTPQVALAQATVVFSGKVVSVTSIPGHEEDHIVIFAVDSRWKGDPEATIRILGPPFCESEFQPDQSYLVYASYAPVSFTRYLGLAPEPVLSPTPCSRTMILTRANADLTALGPGTAPQRPALPHLPGTGHSSGEASIPWLSLACGLLVLGIALHQTRGHQH